MLTVLVALPAAVAHAQVGEAPPKPAFADNAPVIPQESLTNEEFGAVIGTDDPDLTRFRDRGGKIIIVHGLTDQLIPADGTEVKSGQYPPSRL